MPARDQKLSIPILVSCCRSRGPDSFEAGVTGFGPAYPSRATIGMKPDTAVQQGQPASHWMAL